MDHLVMLGERMSVFEEWPFGGMHPVDAWEESLGNWPDPPERFCDDHDYDPNDTYWHEELLHPLTEEDHLMIYGPPDPPMVLVEHWDCPF